MRKILAMLVLGSCGHSVPTTGKAHCPIDEQVQRDAKRLGDESNVVSIVKKTQDEFDTSICSVEVHLTGTTGPQTNLQMQYERVEGNWKLRENKPQHSEQAAVFFSQFRASQQRMCQCTNKACARETQIEQEKLERELNIELYKQLEINKEELTTIIKAYEECEGNIPDDKGVTDNQKRALTAEAVQALRKMSASTVSYFFRHGKLPEAIGATPPKASCCANGDACAPDASLWKSPTWQALDFAMTTPHRYSYEYSRDASNQSFTAIAHGDLDCDGEYSTFTLYGQVVDGELQTAGDVIKMNPFE